VTCTAHLDSIPLAQLPWSSIFPALSLEGIERRGSFHEVRERKSESRFCYLIGVTY
jgi:hypothetical protein